MKYAWTDAGDDPSYDVGDAWGIDGYFFPMFDALTTREEITKAKARSGGKAVGLYMAWNWPQFSGQSPAQVAAIMSEEYKRLYVPGLKVQYNDERHEPSSIIATLEEWRKLRPTVNTSWSMEGMQGGWMSKAFVDRVLACKVRWVPQLYNGSMTQQWDSLANARDLTKRGVPDSLVSPFHDAKRLPYLWDGFVFTLGRLPS